MKELAFQTLVCKAVRAAGGFGMKMSNRFLVGVPDLLLCLDGCSMIVEAKFDRVSPSVRRYTLSLTPKQASSLREMARAGMVVGAVSLLEAGKLFGFKAVPIEDFEGESDLRLDSMTYTWCERRLLPEVVVSDLRQLPKLISVESNPCRVPVRFARQPQSLRPGPPIPRT